MKLKTGDNVKVLSGRDRGKTGKIIQLIRRRDKGDALAVVEGVNMRKKHLRRRSVKEPGQTITLAYPLHISKLQFVEPVGKQSTRLGYRVDGGEKKRFSKRADVIIA